MTIENNEVNLKFFAIPQKLTPQR